MKTGYVITLLALCCFGLAPFAGCGPGAPTKTDPTFGVEGHEGHEGHDHHGHDHDHDHDHDHAHGDLPAHGPNNGHLFKLEGSDLVGEWIHYNDNDIIRVLLLDAKLQNAVAFDGVTFTPTAGSDKTPFVLEFDEEKNQGEMKLVYMLEDKAMKMATTFGVDVEFTMGDKKLKGKIEPHAPHDH